MTSSRLSPQAGIAIGLILFVLALIAVVSIAIGTTSNFTGTTITPDRITADLKAQGDMIKNKILECVQNGKQRLDSYNDPVSGNPVTTPYPASARGRAAGAYKALAVASISCPGYGAGGDNLWTGQSPLMLPAPPAGFDVWYYYGSGSNAIGGSGYDGRCIRIQPLAANATDTGYTNGIANAAANFTSQEATYTPGSTSQRLIIWITPPTGGAPSTDCTP